MTRTLAALVLIALIWAVGLVSFAARIVASTPALEPPRSDAIVALTGASSERLEAAVRLLQDGKGKRLLISGVNPQARRSEVKDVARGVGHRWDCCVDLGIQATSTRGNASETAAWAARHGYHTLIIVTADYHMPRAMLELRSRMPDLTLRPYPVVTDTLDARRWWASEGSARRLVVEYSKYLAILTREIVRGIGAKPQGASSAEPLNAQSETSADN